MSKRARQMALMGFVTGALSDVVQRRSQQRLQEAEARKEARLAAIRAQERGEDRAFTREQFAAQQEAMNTRDERNFEQQKEFFGVQTEQADKRDERNFAQQRQLAAEQRAHAERMANMRGGSERAPNIETFVGPDGKAYNFDINNPQDIARFRHMSQNVGLIPYYASAQGEGRPKAHAAPSGPDFSNVRGTPGATPVRSAPSQPAPAAPVLRYNPKTGRVE